MLNVRFITGKICIIIIICLSLLLCRLYFSYIKENKVYPELPQDLSSYIINNMKRIPDFVGVQVIFINLQKNTRYIMHSHFSNHRVDELYLEFFNDSLSEELPFFTRDNDVINSNLVKIINHEFTCVPYNNTVMYVYVPSAEKEINSVCTIAIPPSYGSLTGAIEIYLSKEPENKDTLITISKNISNRLMNEMNRLP